MEEIIIIGGGPLGLYASTLASLHNLKGILFEGSQSFGGQLDSLYPEKDIIDLPGIGRIRAKDYVRDLVNQTMSKPNHLDLHLSEEVKEINPIEGGYKVTTSKGDYETKFILITTGMGKFSPRKINLPNEDQFSNLLYSVNGLEKFHSKRVCVLGGGDSAVDIANMLSHVCSEVNIVHRRNDFRAQQNSVDELKNNRVRVFKPYLIKSLNGEGNTLKSITISHLEVERDETLNVDYVIVQYGNVTSPSAFPLKSNKQGIEVSTTFETSLPNVYAIGNCIYYDGKVKNLTCGFGEAVIAITKIDQKLNPTKNIPIHF